MPIIRQNVDRTYRNGRKPIKTVTRYVTQAGAAGTAGENSISVFLSQTSATLQAGTEYAVPQTVTLAVIAMAGTRRIHTLVGNITGQVTGMTPTVINNGTAETSIQLTVSGLLNQGGTLTIPVSLNTSEISGYASEWTSSDDMWDTNTWTLTETTLTFGWALALKGEDSSTGGLRGATVRGPVDWADQGLGRWWCDGSTNGGPDDNYKWIDLIMKDGVYYYCNHAYFGNNQTPSWADASAYWTQAEGFEFVATKLIMANNAKIDILGTNSLRLIAGEGQSETVVGGAQGGTGKIYWAGSDNPNNAPWSVDYQGNMYATSGIFSGYTRVKWTMLAQLTKDGDHYIADDRCNIFAQSGWFGTANRLMLPAPTADLNGLTYDILTPADPATKSSMEFPGLEIYIDPSAPGNELSKQFMFFTNPYVYQQERPKMISLYGGRTTITCMPVYGTYGVEYRWGITNATSGGDCFDGIYRYSSNMIWGWATPISLNRTKQDGDGYSDHCVCAIYTTTGNGGGESDIMYIRQ